MSLSSWFRDYLFVPLGGSRYGAAATARNLVLVFFFCGLWHGAAGRFIIWGLFHGVFLALERTPFGDVIQRSPLVVRRAYTLGVVLVGWVFFRAETAWFALQYLVAMAGLGGATPALARRYLSADVIVVLVIGLLFALVRYRPVLRRVPALAFEMAVFAVSLLYVAASTYNPFIYFRF
jgi:alginate O-acetyltransferase complex protein AlgI